MIRVDVYRIVYEELFELVSQEVIDTLCERLETVVGDAIWESETEGYARGVN